jgi:iron(III) transport system permease protein
VNALMAPGTHGVPFGSRMIKRIAGLSGSAGALLAVVVGASIVILALLACVLWLSLRSGNPGDPDAAYSLVNYSEILAEPFTWAVIANTVQFALIALAIAMLFGLPASWLFARTDLPGKALLSTLMTIGLLIPGFASAMGWLFLLHPRVGLVNGWLVANLGLSEAPSNIAGIVGMGWVEGLNLAPVAFIMTAALFRAMDPSLEECAETCGAGRVSIARLVTLRLKVLERVHRTIGTDLRNECGTAHKGGLFCWAATHRQLGRRSPGSACNRRLAREPFLLFKWRMGGNHP